MTPDPRGGVWLGFAGSLGHYREGKLEVIAQINASNLTAEADGSLWVATANGLVRWKDGQIKTLTSKNGLGCDTVFSAIRDERGTLWLYAKCGLIGIANSELDRWWREPGSLVQSTLFDALDGARPSSSAFRPTAARSTDGRLWFVNEQVVQVFDPKQPGRGNLVPPVLVERVRADRKEYPINAVTLPPNPRDIEISYTALSYSIPQRVRFRYKLEPRDSAWQDAGNRRQAFYSDLPPGQYRFHVTASSGEGVWNDVGAALVFSIAPAYYQRAWFYGLCMAAFVGMLWGVHRLRLRQLARELDVRIDVRVEERTRIARELHDTLLQSFQGLMFSFQAARNLLPDRAEDAIRTLDGAISEGDAAIAEGRHAIQGLRGNPMVECNLEHQLTSTGKDLSVAFRTVGEPPAFQVTIEGTRQPLSPLLYDEVYRIAREILQNAFSHARARHIEAELTYDRAFFRLRIRDDGVGIGPEILKLGGRQGHWGLPGARERARRIGATLRLWSELGAGTEAELVVPARIAYDKPDNRQWWRLFRTSGGGEHPADGT